MPDLTAKFSIADKMSAGIEEIAQAGMAMVEQFEKAGDLSSAAFDGMSSGASSAASSVEGVATSVDSFQSAVEGAAGTTDYWTDAVGNYNKSALEYMMSTEELVAAGYKSAEALEEERSVMELAQMATEDLNAAIDTSAGTHDECAEAMKNAAQAAEEMADSDKISEQAKEALQEATERASAAMEELETAQRAAQNAMDNYNAVAESGTATITELEAAALNAGRAADNLTAANEKAATATEELSKQTEKASEEAENSGKKGVDAIEGIANALAAAGITAAVKEIAEAAYELVEAFSEAESTVVLATGATGEALDNLTDSMMNVYAASKTGSLEDTAAAVGEINTRLGYTDEALEETTELFLDFAAATGGNAATSVKSVTQLMNQWNIDASDMESVLSKLTYAGQASGISVDTLTSNLTSNKAILDQLGFSLDEAIAMFESFELSGTQSTSVMTGFRTALTNGTISSVDELYEVLEQCATGELSAADAADIFGSRAATTIVNAAQNGVFALDDMVGALENSSGTLETTANAAQTLEQKWTQASNNISAAFTSAIQPTVDGISSAFAGIVNGIGTFLNEHPAVTKAITAIGVGLGVVVAGIAGVTLVTTVAIPAVTAFGVALNTALGPIGWVALAITGIVAAGAALVAMFSDAEDETADMTAVTKQQYYQLQDLNAEYEEACEKYGETSEEALRLKYEVDDLSAAFEANRQTVEEFTAEVDALIESHEELISSYEESMSAIDQSEVGTLSLIQKLEDLATQTDRTAAQEEQMKAVIDQLNEELPDLALSYDDVSENAEQYVEILKKAAEAQAEEERKAEQKQAYVDLLKEQANLEDEIAKAEENLRLSQESDANASFLSDQWFYDKTGWLGAWATDTNEYADALDELNVAYAENQAALQEIEAEWEEVAQAAQEATESPSSYEEAVSIAYESVKEEIEELCAAYDEAYQAALDSFEGQFGLFDEAEADMEATVEAAQAALDSQLAYWDNYLANVEVLKNTSAEDLGITQENYEALMAYAQDGSEEAAGLAASMAEAIKSGNTEAVAELANTVGEVSAKQEEIAAMTADWQTDFTAQMDAIEQEMQDTIDGMNLSDEAATAASETISSYADQIRAGKSGAVAAAQEVANAVTAALASANTTVNVNVNSSSTVSGHAKGTTNAENAFVAGEEGHELIMRKVDAFANGTTDSPNAFIAGDNGPELILGEQGSTVFPTSETDRLISALNDKQQPLQVLAETGDSKDSTAEQVKRILLEIAGSGAIEVSGETDKTTILEILYEHLKPVLMNIIQSEIYEEGELSYEY